MIIDVEALEEGLVEEAACFRAGVAVEGVRICDEVEGMPKDARTDSEFLRGVRHSGFKPLALALQFDQLHADLRLWHRAVGE
ncbi:hypothetical protein [Nocardia sp. SYP-A9097]|uniref:hypothetical protein n=1 Tax=Nocardia sp. SYP-A9097 TaxID=2663237 RepID=UPI001E467851|nr:hypothetical protein [Nocardia sp. SYP-A9097]